MDSLNVMICGSVDDGKSTLIGRLLWDLDLLLADELVRISPDQKGPDLARLTDGLKAEMEQGITVDVAHRYFQTATRRFHILDCPGHEEFTHNMFVGATQADVAVILTDAREEPNDQTIRHLSICKMLRLPTIVCVNKMDAVGYEEEEFEKSAAPLQNANIYTKHVNSLKGEAVCVIPISALEGDNIADRSDAMDWYSGETLLEALESVSKIDYENHTEGRFLVQGVLRPENDALSNFRAYTGIVTSGTFQAGNYVTVFPSLVKTCIFSVEVGGEKVEKAYAGESVTIRLHGEQNVGRGDLIARGSENMPMLTDKAFVRIVPLGHKYLEYNKTYRLRIGIAEAKGILTGQDSMVDHQYEDYMRGVVLELDRQLGLDRYSKSKDTGSIVFFDNDEAVGAGVIEHIADQNPNEEDRQASSYLANQIISVSGPVQVLDPAEEVSRTGETE